MKHEIAFLCYILRGVTDMDLICERLRGIREDSDLTQGKLAKLLFTNRQRISKIERGKIDPTASDLVAYHQIFHVSADYLLGLTHNPRPDPRKKDR